MFLEVGAHARQVLDDVDAVGAQGVGRPDPGAHKQGRRSESAGAHQDFSARIDVFAAAVSYHRDADGASASHTHGIDFRSRYHLEVGPPSDRP